MEKKLKSITSKRSLADFSDKLSAKWRVRTTSDKTNSAGTDNVEQALERLVSIPSVTGNYEANHEAFDYVDAYLTARGMQVKRYEWNGVESLVATTRKTKEPTVMFLGHIDVVPAPEEMFTLTITEDKYIGRGVLDMKGGVAAYLGAVDVLRDETQDYDFGIMLTSDEEIGGFDGAKRLVEEGYKPGMIILQDGGGNWNIERLAKGIWHLTVTSNGTSAHGSRPWEGDNAVDKLMTALMEIKELFPNQTPEGSTVNVGIIQGGNAINQIPSTATASLDMRFSTPEDLARVVAATTDIATKYGLSLQTEVVGDPVVTNPDNDYMAAYADCVAEVVGKRSDWVISNASHDGRWFAPIGVQCATSYPMGGGHHGPDEWITKDSLRQMQDIFVNYLKKTAKK
jgi:acetylornithine deacetylase/succinyl-diaminopimelate desuccinylase-like protein